MLRLFWQTIAPERCPGLFSCRNPAGRHLVTRLSNKADKDNNRTLVGRDNTLR
jgi:hypothetical protein